MGDKYRNPYYLCTTSFKQIELIEVVIHTEYINIARKYLSTFPAFLSIYFLGFL